MRREVLVLASTISGIIDDWLGAVIGLIVGSVLNIAAVAVFNAIHAEWYYYALLVIVDCAAVYAVVKKLLD